MSGFIDRIKTRWGNYQPTKKSLYKAVGHTAFWILFLGFGFAGWTTQSGAQEIAYQARVDYAAALCADKFRAADFSGRELADLKKVVVRQQRRDLLEKGHWVTVLPGTSGEFVDEASLICGDKLSEGGSGAVQANGKAM